MPEEVDLESVAEALCADSELTFIRYEGGGAFKKVFRVETGTGESRVLKVINGPASEPRTAREIEALQRCDHPNIAQFFLASSYNHDGVQYDYTIEEFVPGGTLASRLANTGILGTEETLTIGKHLVSALVHVAGLNLVHRDIKPENIMLRRDGETPVLVDFGLVRDLSASSLTMTWQMRGPGTPYYAAPEQLNNKKSMIDWRTDQFALGVVLCEARFKNHPYARPGEPIYATVEHVAALDRRLDAVLQNFNDVGLTCLDQMTRAWPVERFRLPDNLETAWNKQRSV